MKVESAEEPVHSIIVRLISSLHITKLVMGLPSTKFLSWKAKVGTNHPFYVHRHKPQFCELFIVCGGKLVLVKISEGNVTEDVHNMTASDLRKNTKEKGSFRDWIGKMLTNNTHVNADPGSSSQTDLPSPEVEDIEVYIEALMASNVEEIDIVDDAIPISSMDQIDRQAADSNMSSLSRTDPFKAKFDEAERMAEKNLKEAKADSIRSAKAERAASICNQKTEKMEACLGEEVAKQAYITDELDRVRAELREVSGHITESQSKLKSVLALEEEVTMKLQASSLEKVCMESKLKEVVHAKLKLVPKMEEARRQRDSMKLQIEYWRRREEMGIAEGVRYREFSLEELSEVTGGFSEQMVISAGNGGVVYKGRINHVSVAIQFKNEFCFQLPEEFKAQEVMKEPYVAADGFSYEYKAIKEWLDSGHETSPMTNLKMKNKLLMPNHTLRSLIDCWHKKV